jgi:hypothetical protein
MPSGRWVDHRSDDPHPFIWRKTVDEIITKVKRGCFAKPLWKHRMGAIAAMFT